MTKDEIAKTLYEKLEDRAERIKYLEKFADTYQIRFSIDREASFRALILYLFPCMYLTNNLPYRANGIEAAIERIYFVANNPEYCALRSVNITAINRKQKQIKLFKMNMYEFFNWKYFGLNGKTEIVKEFNNGYAWIKFTEPTDWEKFIKVYDFANESTELIINALDHTDKVKFQDRARSVNKFSAMYEILEQKGLPVHYINAGLIIEFLES